MAKSILVVDYAGGCRGCPFRFVDDDCDSKCFLTKDNVEGCFLDPIGTAREDDCPLKEMPSRVKPEPLSEELQKKSMEESARLLAEATMITSFAHGWNRCLEEIENG